MEYFSGSHWSITEQIMIEDVTIKRITTSTSTTTSTTSPTTATTPTEMSTLIMAGAAVAIAVVGGISLMLKKRQPTHGTLVAKVL